MGSSADHAPVVLYGPTLDALGGGEIWIERIANELAARGTPVTALGHRRPVSAREGTWHPAVRRAFVNSGATVMPAAVSRMKSFAIRAADTVTGGRRPTGWYERRLTGEELDRLAELLSGQEDAFVICTDLYTSLAMHRLRSENRIRNRYASVHHNTIGALSAGSLNALRATTKTSSALVALTEEDAREFRRSGFPEVIVIPNPTPPVPESVALRSEENFVTWVGRMSPEKDLPLLFRAWREVARQATDWRLELYGDGELRPSLEALSIKLGVAHSVDFRGAVPNSDVAFRHASLNVLTSRLEGWGLVIGEAAAFGVPTVAVDCAPGVREQVRTGETGILVNDRRPTSVANALLTLIRDETARHEYGENAKAYRSGFEVARIVDHWQAFLRQFGTQRV